MAIHEQERGLFTEADLDVYGVMLEAIAGVSPERRAARCAAATDLVLSWIPNCTRPVTAIGEYLKQTIGIVASETIMRLDRGVSGGDRELLEELRAEVARERELIMTAGNSKGIRLAFEDSTPHDDDFAPLGVTHQTSDDWTTPV